jgi:outer membrane protein assembly factor BamD (BamD/ComL family)
MDAKETNQKRNLLILLFVIVLIAGIAIYISLSAPARLYRQGVNYLSTKDYRNAAISFEKAITTKANSKYAIEAKNNLPQCYIEISRQYLADDQPEKALNYFSYILSNYQSTPEYETAKSEMLILIEDHLTHEDDFQLALQYLDEIINKPANASIKADLEEIVAKTYQKEISNLIKGKEPQKALPIILDLKDRNILPESTINALYVDCFDSYISILIARNNTKGLINQIEDLRSLAILPQTDFAKKCTSIFTEAINTYDNKKDYKNAIAFTQIMEGNKFISQDLSDATISDLNKTWLSYLLDKQEYYEAIYLAHNIIAENKYKSILADTNTILENALLGLSTDPGKDGSAYLHSIKSSACGGEPLSDTEILPYVGLSTEKGKAVACSSYDIDLRSSIIAQYPAELKYVVLMDKTIQDGYACNYGFPHQVIPQFQNWLVSINDVITGKTLKTQTFTGPGYSCPEIYTFYGSETTAYEIGGPPNLTEIGTFVEKFVLGAK